MTAMILLREWQASQVEFWRKTQYDGYDVSSFGQVRSFWRKGSPPKRVDVWHLVKGTKDSYGYLFVEIRREHPDAPRRRFWVHREIALTFLPNPNDLPEVNHRTAVKADNRLDNFEWVSSAGNVQHAQANGLRDNAALAGELSPKAKLTENDVREIRQRVASGEKVLVVADDYSMTKGGIRHVITRRSWKHVE